MIKITPSELILNPDGSIYHLNLKREHISENIILVGDQNRVSKVAHFFDTIKFEVQNREFKCITGSFKNKIFTVVSTGIGSDNIDIVINELDALVNIDLDSRTIKKKHTSLNIVRIGTSGSLQKNIPLDCFVLSKYGLGLDGMLHTYDCKHILEAEMENAFIRYTNYSSIKSRPYIVRNSKLLEEKLFSKMTNIGITVTAPGFYGPQGRILRIPVQDSNLNDKMSSFRYDQFKITNLEMETSAIYGLSKLLGHHAISMNAIIANRLENTFSRNPDKTIEKLIDYTLNKLAE